ncbi:hypothetical protein B296_00055228 [Ensete ventricosum]|uniref:Uncharacterized protein n=1 Tax=Ensete ventricosum TaxID=4639 RepID=A0A426Y0R8_ENSVE|nr:hypothetical protein B296_00055228 [Ensete ventricosum]
MLSTTTSESSLPMLSRNKSDDPYSFLPLSLHVQFLPLSRERTTSSFATNPPSGASVVAVAASDLNSRSSIAAMTTRGDDDSFSLHSSSTVPVMEHQVQARRRKRTLEASQARNREGLGTFLDCE